MPPPPSSTGPALAPPPPPTSRWLHRCRVLERTGRAPTVMFVHGMDATAAWWDPVLSQLHQRGWDHHTISLDLPGHGASDPGPAPLTVPAVAAPLTAIADTLTAGDAGQSRVVLVGHSLGAATALQLAAEHPERVDAVICVDGGIPDPTARHGPQWQPAYELMTAGTYQNVPYQILAGWVRGAVGGHAVAAVTSGYAPGPDHRWSPRLTAAARRSLLHSLYDIDGLALLHRVNCPVQVLVAPRTPHPPPRSCASSKRCPPTTSRSHGSSADIGSPSKPPSRSPPRSLQRSTDWNIMADHDRSASTAMVADLLARQNTALAARDLDQALELFAPGPDTLLVGSETGEIAHGTAEIAEFFTRIFTRPHIYQWDWAPILTAHIGDDIAMFAHGHCARISSDTGTTLRQPYRASAIARRHHGTLQWRLFHGAEPC